MKINLTVKPCSFFGMTWFSACVSGLGLGNSQIAIAATPAAAVAAVRKKTALSRKYRTAR